MTAEGPAETTYVPCADGGEAAAVWRSEKLKNFSWRLRCLGLDQDPDFAALLAQISEQNAALEQMWQQQQQPGYEQPWWADGEYDEQRSDSANDEGLRLLKAGALSEAFDAFTEAIRLHPRSPVYHSNRAAVCLRLGRADLAAEDAEHALQRDPRYLKALLRGAKARLALQQAEEAAALFQRALEVQPGQPAATKGAAAAAELLRQQAAQRAAEAAASAAGSRPGLPREGSPEEDAAAALYAAAQMLAANPRLQAARAARIEGLILCQRYREAAAECEGLLEGPDRQYLEAEIAWRQGDLAAALASLDAALAAAPGVAKCVQLRQFVGGWEGKWREAELAREDGELRRCAELCGEVLAAAPPAAAPGLHCVARRLRAEAAAARGLLGEALADLNAALAVESSHAGCLQLRAEVHKQAGDYMAAVLDLHRLQKVAPGTAGLWASLEQAAKLALGGRQQQPPRRGGGSRAGEPGAGGFGGQAADPFAVLGLGAGATLAEIRRAYLKLAAKWHPDKWAGAAEGEQAAAEAKFKEVQRAYEELTG